VIEGFRLAVLARLRALGGGRLRISDGARSWEFGPAGAGRRGELVVMRRRFWRRVALGGSIGAAEAYRDGDWHSPDLVALLRVFAADAGATDDLEARLGNLRYRLAHRLRANHRRGSRRNIAAHYDLGNDFFALLLDDTLTYSCALFEPPELDLAAAQEAKLERACRTLALAPDHDVLEIGTGWGSFALHAAGRHRCRVTTTTVSAAQRRVALERVRAAGLADRVRVLGDDYRDLDGRFDRLASIEMIEAIGPEHYGTYFAVLAARLRRGGRALIQAITVADHRYRTALRQVDVIRYLIFPGSTIPSLSVLLAAAANHSDLRMVDYLDMTEHYARTLAAWRDNLRAHHRDARALGYDAAFLRLWDYYLAYCQAGFSERYIAVGQLALSR
jgi:cyclopropane-fatty-acyl-phospholipid synthase